MFGRMLSSQELTDEEKTRYRYYCEAIIMLGHFQRPGVVEGMTVSDLVLM